MDPHWQPASRYCSLCSISYDSVVRFEDLSEEAAFLRHLINPGEDGGDGGGGHQLGWFNPTSADQGRIAKKTRS